MTTNNNTQTNREIKHMPYKELERYYLCGIGTYGKVEDFRVGTFNAVRESYSFPNGSYSAMELWREPKGGNATYVITAVSLEEIDDAGMLYEKILEVEEEK